MGGPLELGKKKKKKKKKERKKGRHTHAQTYTQHSEKKKARHVLRNRNNRKRKRKIRQTDKKIIYNSERKCPWFLFQPSCETRQTTAIIHISCQCHQLI